MKKFAKALYNFGRLCYNPKNWYVLAFIGVISLSAFHSIGKEEAPEPLMHKLPDSLTVMDHDFARQLLKEYRTRKIADSLVTYARKMEGKPYRWGGKSPKGFDCSGFVAYVYNAFGFPLNGSSRVQSQHGKEIELNKVKKGDVLFFTGSNPRVRHVGHVGIVVSAQDEDIRFVHASTNSGVIESELKGYYQTRLLTAKRMLAGNL